MGVGLGVYWGGYACGIICMGLGVYWGGDYSRLLHIIYSFSFHGSSQDYKIHMDMEAVSTVLKSNKNIFLKKSGSEVSVEMYNSFSYWVWYGIWGFDVT